MNDEPNADSETGRGSASDPPRMEPRPKLWRRFICYQMRMSHQRKTEREKKHADEKPQDRAARKTANATIWIAIFTIVLALANIWTLVEVIRGGSDTHALAVAAGYQAMWTQRLADAAKVQSDKTQLLADRMKDQADRTADLANTSRDELVEVQRAFIFVKSIDTIQQTATGTPSGYDWALTAENSGGTDARQLRMRRNCGTATQFGLRKINGFLDFLDFSKLLLDPQAMTIGPHSTQTFGNCAALASLVDNGGPWFIFGQFTYRDIFDQPHLT